jgi:integrase
MRSFEAALLKGSDIDSERRMIHIRRGKGARDRDLQQTPKQLEALREGWRWKSPEIYIFPPPRPAGIGRVDSDKTVWDRYKIATARVGNLRLSHR